MICDCVAHCRRQKPQAIGRQKIGQGKNDKHKHFGRDGVPNFGTNRNRLWTNPSLGQPGPVPGTNRDPSLRQTGRFLFNSNRHFVPFVPGTGPGLSLGRLPSKGRQKKVFVFCVSCFFRLQDKAMLHCNLRVRWKLLATRDCFLERHACGTKLQKITKRTHTHTQKKKGLKNAKKIRKRSET